MKVIVVASQKGGVGKTTLSLNLSYALAKRGWRVLVVDCDPQGAIGLGLSDKLEGAPGLAEFIVSKGDLSSLAIQTRLAGLSLLVRGRVSPQYTPQFASALENGTVFQRLYEAAKDSYEIVLVDTPCGFSGITLGAMRHADYVISPVQSEPVSLRSIPQLLQVINWFQREGHSLQMSGFVMSMLQDQDDISQSVAQEMLDTFPQDLLFNTHIPRDSVFLKASAAGVPVGLLSRRPPAQANLFDTLALEVEERIALHEDFEDEPLSLLD